VACFSIACRGVGLGVFSAIMSPTLHFYRCPNCKHSTPIPAEMLASLATYQGDQTTDIDFLVLACSNCTHVSNCGRAEAASADFPELPPKFLHWSCARLLLQCDEPNCTALTPMIALKKTDTTIQELRKAVEDMPIYGALVCRQSHRISQVNVV
jgi:hypothetical protein